MYSQQKRKRTGQGHPELHWLASHLTEDELGPIQSLCIEAHEADLVVDKEALAGTLEAPDASTNLEGSKIVPGTRGSGLIKWNSGRSEDDAWVDRFDARLLLSELPVSCSAQQSVPGSPVSSSGWSDLPSDAEDAFFLTPDEVEDMRYAKRRRMLEEARTERLAALRAAGDDSVASQDVDAWGDSDEEPDAAQMQLMERTAAHLQASPDRTRLAARILANHGADKRFAFMRGRWHRAWLRAQAKAAATAAEQEEKKNANNSGIMGLAAYEDSDEDESGASEVSETPVKEQPSEEEAKMEARRARARAWAAKRRAEKDVSENISTQ